MSARNAHGTILASSATDYAYLMLREGIEMGRFPPGRRMREVELAEWLGVSRTPVRQALARLQSAGILVVAPRQGLVVASLDTKGIIELYDMRSALEGAAASLAAQRAHPTEIADLEKLVAAEQNLPDDPQIRAQHNCDFHQQLYAAAHNRFLDRIMQSLNDTLDLIGPTTLGHPDRSLEATREHHEIVAAIAARDAPRAEKAARQHVEGALKVRLQRLPPTSAILKPTQAD